LLLLDNICQPINALALTYLKLPYDNLKSYQHKQADEEISPIFLKSGLSYVLSFRNTIISYALVFS